MDNLHGKNGDLDTKIGDLCRDMLALKATVDESPNTWASKADGLPSPKMSPMLDAKSIRAESYLTARDGHSTSPGSPQLSPELRPSEFGRRESELLPAELQYPIRGEPLSQYEKNRRMANLGSQRDLLPDPMSSPVSPSYNRTSGQSWERMSRSPPSRARSMGMNSDIMERRESYESTVAESTITEKQVERLVGRTFSTVSEQELFERKLFSDSAVLCDLYVEL